MSYCTGYESREEICSIPTWHIRLAKLMGPGKKEIRIQENMDPGPDPIVLLFSLANLTSSNSNLKKRSLSLCSPKLELKPLSLSLSLSLSAFESTFSRAFLTHSHTNTEALFLRRRFVHSLNSASNF